MIASGLLQFGFYLVLLLAMALPLGWFMARVYEGKRHLLSPLCRPIEHLVYRLIGIDPERQTTMSHFSQMAGLAVQNFLSAAAGMAVLVVLIRGLRSRQAAELGNFWVDLTRTVVHILLPLSLILALALVSQGVVQSFAPPVETATQTLPLGPAASQIAIKQLGTNGGGFFNVNSAHPFENPTPLSPSSNPGPVPFPPYSTGSCAMGIGA